MSRKNKGKRSPGESSSSGAAREREHRIRTLSDQLVLLFQRLDRMREESVRILNETDLAKGPSEYERMRQRLAISQENIAAVGEEIGRMTAQLRAVQVENPDFNAVETDPVAQLEAKILALGRRLNEIADNQAAAVSDWNSNPIPERRAAFEAQLAQLHAEFAELLKQQQALLREKQGR